MGDGRYYSSSQFINIVYLTLLIIFVVISLMINLYKGKNKIVLTLYIFLGISVLLRFIETIARSIDLVHLCRICSDMFLALFIVFYGYLLINIKKLVKKRSAISMAIFFGLSVIVSIFNFDTKAIMYILFTLNLYIAAKYFIPYRVTTSIFGDIKELVLDYVFIVDDNCKIIYKNNNISNSSIFNNLEEIDHENIEKIFANPSIVRKAYNKSFIKVLECNKYFQYNKKEIMDEDKIAGYIVTFTDITNLIDMLDNLKLKQEQTKDINIKLARYKEIVYDTEKEREINILLEEIAKNQQKSMQELKIEIEDLSKNIDSNFNANIQRTIEKAKSDLLNVRRAVTEYINYYEK